MNRVKEVVFLNGELKWELLISTSKSVREVSKISEFPQGRLMHPLGCRSPFFHNKYICIILRLFLVFIYFRYYYEKNIWIKLLGRRRRQSILSKHYFLLKNYLFLFFPPFILASFPPSLFSFLP